MSHAENILEILAREERKRAARIKFKQTTAGLILQRTLDNLEKSERLLAEISKRYDK